MRSLVVVLLAALVPATAFADADPLAAELSRAASTAIAAPADDAFASDLRQGLVPGLERARSALAAGRRAQALHLYAQLSDGVAALDALRRLPAGARTLDAFEASWRAAAELHTRTPVPPLRPALVRALAEAAALQAKVLYDASLDYGRSTTADSGFYYLEAARGQRALVTALARLQETPDGAAPAVRDIAADIDGLRAELLAMYQPPASIDRHPEFISASAALKEARELNEAGLHHGALLRYLQAALRVGRIRDPLPAPPAVVLPPGVDHSLARAFVEAADEARASEDAERRRTVHAVTDVVLPRYLAALAPSAADAPRAPASAVTVTLVRWPYT